MTNLSRLEVIRLFAFSMLLSLLPATSWAQQRPPIAEQMSKTYGLDSFGQIEGIRYTFNAELPGVELSRKWEWNPKTDAVSYEGKDKEGKPVKATYQRSQLGSQSDAVKNEIDPAFLNDQYWLLLPFHVVWDSSATGTDEGVQGWRLLRGRHVGTLRRRRQPDRGVHLPPGRNQEAQRRHHDVGGLQEGRPTPYLDGSPRDGG